MAGGDRDLGDFVSARFAELHAVAAVTAGDAEAAAHITATALAERWDELATTGTPTSTARLAVLTAVLSSTSGTAASGTTPRDPLEMWLEDDRSVARAALTAALAAAPVTARAALAAAHFWDESPVLVAACAKTDPAAVRYQVEVLERTLAHEHAAALGRESDQLAWALPEALADALEHLADTAAVPDPVDLVNTVRTRAAHRRRTRAVATAAAAVLALSAAVALARPPRMPAGSVSTLALNAPQWAGLNSWAPRGPLAGDLGVTALVEQRRTVDPGTHLLWAGPVGDTTTVVMTSTRAHADPPRDDSGRQPASGPTDAPLRLRLWTGRAELGAAGLSPTPIEGPDVPTSHDVLALSIKQGASGAPPVVLVMTRPTVTVALASTGARPGPDGSSRPVGYDLTMTDGVTMFTERPGFPSRVAVDNTTSSPAGTLPLADRLPERGSAAQLADAQRTALAVVTDYAAGSLYPTAVLDEVLAIPDPHSGTLGTEQGPVHLSAVTVATPNGGWVRTTRLCRSELDAGCTFLERLAAVPADDHAYALLLVEGQPAPTFVAVAPGAATAELVTEDGQVRDTAGVRNGLAVLTSSDVIATSFRLRLRAPDGHLLYDKVPPRGTELLG